MKNAKKQPEKKLSLKKLQVIKISNMKAINGGYGGQGLELYGDGEPTPPIRQNPSSQCNDK
ncbi:MULTISPECIES: hypothetical protein [Chryseobacterium]|jgi:hypothetical protein|uniref:Bacteriocin n=1 Tax=Chryseobacterium indicum TaxID=2766954 RepID=A0ABS9CB40_9FLAO|nr:MULTISPECIES: hypothetical protein [unclassified Chryseobacterium]MCF2220963.1 hypothetical protein [Chryseobacterium sp. PS-8]PVV53539.1 hypothetical protein DD829_18705 [Chryseobacterium sp. HMWF035]